MAKRLKTAFDCRRFLANLINRTESGEVDPALASKLGYLINIQLRSIEASSMEKRLEKIEESMGK